MKQIINSKLYNTETAKHIGNKYGRSISTSIYQKKTGEYFLCNYNYYTDDNITPLSLDEAKGWICDNLSADEYMSLFGEVEE